MKLTARQTEIRDLIVGGLRSKEIARQLGISYRTVDKLAEIIMAKYNVHSRVQLAHAVLTGSDK